MSVDLSGLLAILGKEYCIGLFLWELPATSIPNRNTFARDLLGLGETRSLCSQAVTLSASVSV